MTALWGLRNEVFKQKISNFFSARTIQVSKESRLHMAEKNEKLFFSSNLTFQK